jgi:hypothetical protein
MTTDRQQPPEAHPDTGAPDGKASWPKKPYAAPRLLSVEPLEAVAP